MLTILILLGSILGPLVWVYRRGVRESQATQREAKLEARAQELEGDKRVATAMTGIEKKQELIEAEKEVAKENARAKKTLKIGKWLVLFGLAVSLTACASAPKPVIVRPDIPRLEILPRPDLQEVELTEGERLTDEQLQSVFGNETELKAQIKKYEAEIEAYQRFYKDWQSRR